MTTPSLPQRLLGRSRWIVAGALTLAVAIGVSFVFSGAGTGMSAIEMTRMTGPAGALIAGTDDMIGPVLWTPFYAVAILLMWWLMMVAMMLPSAAPTILLYGALNPSRGAAAPLEFLSGYLAVWAGFSVLATAAQGLLAATGLVSAMFMNLASPLLGSAILIGAGAYQLTPVKAACLAHCRSPVDVLTRHRRTGSWAAFRMGVVHGTYCLGCCWALMALLFVGGIMNLWWIVGLAIYVGVEKLAPGGQRVAQALGLALIASGVALFFLDAR